MNKQPRVAFSAERNQPFTNGHFYLNSEMLRDNDVIIVGIGSTQIQGTSRNPFSPEQRKEMYFKVFGKTKKIKFVYLRDIGAVYPGEWQDYCLKRIKDSSYPTPTHYYCGSKTDGYWFEGAENLNGDPIELVTLKRYDTPFMPGTNIRASITNDSDEWEEHVPKCLIEYIKDNYPKDLMIQAHRDH